jgi:phenylacetate-CoA ligase
VNSRSQPRKGTSSRSAHQFPGPVCIQGISTGGSIAQQFAIDHPQLIRRLVLAATAAAIHSPFYRRWFAETGALGAEPVQLARLPVLDKSLLMEHFDELVCDPRLRRDALLGWVGQMTGDQLCLDRYRVMLTSGSSGRPGLFVYDAAGWRSIPAQLLRSSSWAGLRPSVPRQRVAWLGGAAPFPHHPSGGGHPSDRPASGPRLAGRLRLSPQMLVTAAELRTPEMTQRLQEAFGVHPVNAYGCTEGLWDSECEHHQGIHLFEDTTLVENVDPDDQPVPAGQPGGRLLVTNLSNLVQPLLRLEVTDLVTLDPDPCRCGRTLVRASAIHGRSDDVLSLPARNGGRVAVHPLQFALLTRDPQVREFQVVQDGPVLRVLIVAGQPPSPAAAADVDGLESRLGQAVTQQLLGLGAQDPQVAVERRQQLRRSAGGKFKLVIADPAPRPVHTNTS